MNRPWLLYIGPRGVFYWVDEKARLRWRVRRAEMTAPYWERQYWSNV